MGIFHLKQKKKGFTLVEVLAAVAILGLLASIVYASGATSRKKARDTQRVSDIQQLAIAFRLYKDFNSAYPTYASGDLIGNGAGVDVDIAANLTGAIKDPVNSGSNRYYYDSSYDCNGTVKAVIFAQAMELASGANYVSECGPVGSASDIGIGVTPTATTYIMVLN